MGIRLFLYGCGLLLALAFAAEAAEPPTALVWQLDGKSLSRKQYLKDIDFISRHTEANLLAVAPVDGVNVTDPDQFRDAFAELVAAARAKGIRVALRQEPGVKGFFNAGVDGADAGTYVIEDPSLAQGLAYESVVTADADGFASVTETARGARKKIRPLRNELLRVYAFDRTGDGFYRPGSCVDITAKARVVTRSSERQTVEVDAGKDFAGKAISVLTCQYFNYYDLFGEGFLRYQRRVMESLRDVPLAGYYLDESGYMVLDTRNIRRGLAPAWRERFYSPAMAAAWRVRHGTDLVRTLFDMRHAPAGDDGVRIRAINGYMEFMRMRPLELERAVVAEQRRIWGDDLFLACHSTFHNHLDDDEVWHTGCDWWDVPRDFGFTDERTDFPTRMGVLFGAKEPKLLHMFYSKDPEDYYREIVALAPFNGREFHHAYNDGVWGQGFNETKTPFLKNIARFDRVIRSLNGFQNVLPRMDLLVVFGTAAQFNWYPDAAARNVWDVDGSLGIEQKVREMWADGVRCALVPDTMITDGRLKAEGGGFVYNGHAFARCLYLYPKYAKKAVYKFLNSAADLPLAVVGRADIDFDAAPASFRGRHYEAYSKSILDDLKVPRSAIPGGAVYEDGSFALVSRGIIDGQATAFDFTVDGIRYAGRHTGLLAWRKGTRALATPGGELRINGKPVELAACASWWGTDEDDATECLQSAINSGATTLIVDKLGSPWTVRPLFGVSDQKVVFERGVVVQAKPGAFRQRQDCLLSLVGRHNVTLSGSGATLRMRRDDYCREPYKFGEWRHALSITGCRNVTVKGLAIEQSGGDGIYISPLEGPDGNSRDIVIRDVVCDRNLRQGLSVIGAQNLLVENCVFRNTKGAPPEAGIDFEPNGPDEPLVNCRVRNCLSEDNAGDGIDVIAAKSDLSTPPITVCFENCRVRGCRKGFYYHDGRIPRDGLFPWKGGEIRLSGCEISKCRENAVFVRHKPFSSAKVVFSKCRFDRNGTGNPALSDVDVGVSGHRSMKPNVFEFNDVTIVQDAARSWLATTDGGAVLKGNPTCFRGAVKLVDAAGGNSLEVLDRAWMQRRFRWERNDDPMAPPRVEPTFQGVKVVDAVPGELCSLPAVEVYNSRFSSAFAFFADRPCRVKFKMKQNDGKGGGPGGVIEVSSYASGKNVAKVALPPGGKETEVSFDVPERGCYRFRTPGQRIGFSVTAANVPLALDLTKGSCPFSGCEKDMYFYVCGNRPFSALANGDGKEGVLVRLFDPSGACVWQRDVDNDGDYYVSGSAPTRGLWKLEVCRSGKYFFEDHSLGLSGVNAFLFLDKNRYWYASRDR